jgi:hypothetical protein
VAELEGEYNFACRNGARHPPALCGHAKHLCRHVATSLRGTSTAGPGVVGTPSRIANARAFSATTRSAGMGRNGETIAGNLSLSSWQACTLAATPSTTRAALAVPPVSPGCEDPRAKTGNCALRLEGLSLLRLPSRRSSRSQSQSVGFCSGPAQEVIPGHRSPDGRTDHQQGPAPLRRRQDPSKHGKRCDGVG